MDIEVIKYRVYRLRRLLVLSALVPLAFIWVLGIFLPAIWIFAPIAIAVPVVHAGKYPHQWIETVSLSLLLVLAVILISSIGHGVGPFGVVLRLFAIAVVCAVGFLFLQRAA